MLAYGSAIRPLGSDCLGDDLCKFPAIEGDFHSLNDHFLCSPGEICHKPLHNHVSQHTNTDIAAQTEHEV